MQRRYFTIEEAEEELPQVRRLVTKLQRLKSRIARLVETKDCVLENVDSVDSEQDAFALAFAQEVKINKELHKNMYAFFKALDELNEIGCVVKDVDEGLVDFFYPLKDRDVLLCWKNGEDKIKHWHELDEGFANRRPVIDLDEFS